MDINHITLSPAALAALYKDHLVGSGEQEATKPAPASPMPAAPPPAEDVSAVEIAAVSYKSLGNNAQKVLVLVNREEVMYLPDQELNFLTGILTACKLSLADVAILNLFQYPGTGYKELVAFFSSRKVLLFGIEPIRIGLPMNFPAFQSQAFNNCTYLWAPELSAMENDRGLKTQLWNSLKILFTI